MAAKFLSKPCRQHREFQKAPVSLSRGDTVLMPSMQESPLRCSERLLRTVCKILARRISHPALEDKSAASKSRHHRLSPCEAKHFTCPELGGSKNKKPAENQLRTTRDDLQAGVWKRLRLRDEPCKCQPAGHQNAASRHVTQVGPGFLTTRHLQLSSVSFHHGNRKTANSDSEEAGTCRKTDRIATLLLH